MTVFESIVLWLKNKGEVLVAKRPSDKTLKGIAPISEYNDYVNKYRPELCIICNQRLCIKCWEYVNEEQNFTRGNMDEFGNLIKEQKK